MYKLLALMVLFLAVALKGCATLSKSECHEADWQVIGFEDGSAGRPVGYVGKHRKACAEHGVKPNLGRYKQGHAEGAIAFCTPRKAYQLGNSGRTHNDICPADLRDAFIEAYDDGRLVHSAREDLRLAGNQLLAAKQERDEIAQQVAALEAKLVSGGGSAEERQSWLDEVKLLQLERGRLEVDIHDFEHEVSELEREYEYLSSQFSY